MGEPVEQASSTPDASGAELNARARRALREARTEAVVVLAIDVALLGGPRVRRQGEGLGHHRPAVVGVAAACLARPVLMILLLAVPRALLSPGRVRNAGVALLGLLVASDAFAVGVLLAALAGSSAASLSAGDLLAHGAVVWLTNIITFGLLFWLLDEGGPRDARRARSARPRLRVPAGRQAGEPAGARG